MTGPVEETAAQGAELEAVRQARAEGFAEGMAAAQSKLEREWQEQWRGRLLRLQQSVERLRAMELVLRAETQGAVLELAVRLAQRLLEHELQTRPATLLELTRAVVDEARGATEVVLHMHPQDLELLAAEGQAAPIGGGGLERIRIKPDPTLQRGDCVVHADGGTLDGRLKTRLEALRTGIQGSAEEEPGRGEAP